MVLIISQRPSEDILYAQAMKLICTELSKLSGADSKAVITNDTTSANSGLGRLYSGKNKQADDDDVNV